MADEAATGLGKGGCFTVGIVWKSPQCFTQGTLVSPGCDVPVVEQAGGDDGKLASVTLGAVVP